QIVALGLDRVLRGDELHRLLELCMVGLDLGRDVLPVVEDRLHHADVHEREADGDENAEDDAPVALAVAAIPRERAIPQRAQVERQLHLMTSAVSEKRSLSPCRVVGELNVTFLKRFDFSSAVMMSDA